MAFPTYQAAGAFVETATANATISPAWPTHQAGDVAFLIVTNGGKPFIVNDYAGFRELPCSHQFGFVNGRSDTQGLAVYWKRATGAAEAAPVIKNTSKNQMTRASIVTFRGCAASGLPYTSCKGHKEPVAVNAVPAPGLTTIHNDQLILFIAAVGPDVSGSAWTMGNNATLANETERIDSNSTIGEGANTFVGTAELATPGAFGTTTLTYTVANNSQKGVMTVALTPQVHADPKSPYLHAMGEEATSTSANVSPAWPQHVANDIGLLVVESDDFPIATPSGGWAHVTGSPQAAGSPGDPGAVSMSVFWKRAASAAEAAPTVTFLSDHIKAFIVTVKDAKSSGDPFDAGAGTPLTPGSATITFPAVTTLQANSLILHFGGLKSANSGVDFDVWANANLENISERYDLVEALLGSGSGIALLRANKVTPGSTGNTTGTYSSGAAQQARITLSFPPSEKAMDGESGTFNITGQAAVLAFGRVLEAEHGVFTLAGQDVVMNKVRAVNLIAEPGIFNIAWQPALLEKEFGRWVRESAKTDTVWTHEAPEE